MQALPMAVALVAQGPTIFVSSPGEAGSIVVCKAAHIAINCWRDRLPANLACDRPHRCPPRGIILRVLSTIRTARADVRRVLVRRLGHNGTTFSGVGASGKPGADHSATPWRGRDDDESARLASRFDRRWLPADQEGLHEELKQKKVLSQLRYSPIRYDGQISLTSADVRHFEQYGELPESLVEKLGANPVRNERILERILKSDASSIFLFANSVKHAQYFEARLHLAGCPAAAVSGETDRLARQHFIRRFRSGELRVLCNHSVLTTGFDAPRSDMIVISRLVFSPVRYMQMVGRGLRGPANGGTESCKVATVEDSILNYQDRLAHHYCRRFFVSNL